MSGQLWTGGAWQSGVDDLEGIVSVGSLEAVGDGNVICLPPDFRMVASFARWPANARLIAAAPDLYEALEKIVESGVSIGGHHRALARAALSKANPPNNDGDGHE